MKLIEAKKVYSEILSTIKKHKDFCIFDIEMLEIKSNLHLLGIELKEKYGLNIDPTSVSSFDWIDFGEHLKIAWYGDKYNRTISWSDNGEQPQYKMLIVLKFPTGAYIFGDGGVFNKDYPTTFFAKFWNELLSFNPDYIDTHNHTLYWNLKNGKDIFNSFNDILKKYYALNSEDIKQRRIEKMKSDLAKLEAN